MILEAIQKNELGKLMRERMTCILSMNAVHLNLCWTAEFLPEQIHTCCVRMVECLDCTVEFPKMSRGSCFRTPGSRPGLRG